MRNESFWSGKAVITVMAEINGAEKTDARYEANGIFWAMGDGRLAARPRAALRFAFGKLCYSIPACRCLIRKVRLP
jgi:hypothetical protein